MKYKKENYIGKLVQFYPDDYDAKCGYVRDVDDLGFTIEVTGANREQDLGVMFISHSKPFVFKEVAEMPRLRFSKN